MNTLERVRADLKRDCGIHGQRTVYAADLSALLRAVEAADDMPDEVACNRLGADAYAEEFAKLRDRIAALKKDTQG